MERPIGIWIDHRRAVVYDLASKSATAIAVIDSGADEQRGPFEAIRHVLPHRYGGSRAHHMQRRRERTLEGFYARVAHAINAHAEVVIGGPNGAGGELAEHLGAAKQRSPRVLGVTHLDTHLSDHAVVEALRALAKVPA